jgi:hypothetical protein
MRGRAGQATPLVVLAAAAALTLLLAWPVVCHPTERILGTETAGRHHDPFTVMRQFGGAPVSPPYLQPATDWLGRALAVLVPPVAAYNLVVLVTFPFSALTAYLFARKVTGDAAGAAVAGLAFAFAPFHVAHSSYHPHIAQVQWVPLFLFALWQNVHRVTFWRALCLPAAAAVAVLANTYNVLLLAVIAPCASLVFWRMPAPDGERPALRNLVVSMVALGAAAGLALLCAWWYVPSAFSPNLAVRPEELVEYGARWWSYLVPPVDHPWLGGAARKIWAARGVRDGLLEQQVSMGWTVLVLALVGLIWSRRSPGERQRAWGLAGVALLAVACSLSPGDAASRWHATSPAAWLHRALPMFRAYARFAVVVQLMVTVLAGVGVTILWRRPGTRVVALVLLGLLGFEYAPLAGRSRDVLPTSAHRWLTHGAAPRAVLDCTGPSLAEVHTPWLAGYPVGYLGGTVADCGEPGLGSKLATLGYSHAIVRREDERRFLAEGRPAGLRRVYRGLDADVFEVSAHAGFYLGAPRGFFEREYDGADTWRWADDRTVSFDLVAPPGTTARPVTIALALEAFAEPRHVVVWLDRAKVASLDVLPTRAAYAIGPFALAGTHELAFTSLEPARSPASLGGSRDTRRLAFRIFDWTLSTPH